ncbi:MAG: hypothetical protein QOE34_275 [Verrucomicrobiota bacterium]|jgi:hypothetical protein
MKPHYRTWIALLTLACSATANAGDIKARIVGYGTYKVSDKYKRIETQDAPSGAGRSYNEGPIFTAVTDHIPARMGIRFGIVFELTNLPAFPGTMDLVQVLKYPPIHKPDGTTSTRFERPLKLAVSNGRIASWTGYGFDHDYELVPGIWTFEIKFRGKTLCKQDFKVARN